MPRQGSAGFSDHTPIKQYVFAKFMQMHVTIVASIMERYPHLTDHFYLYIDLYAGPGISDNVHRQRGSALLALDTLRGAGLWSHVELIEQNHETAKLLARHLAETFETLEDFVPTTEEWQFMHGLDPCGGSLWCADNARVLPLLFDRWAGHLALDTQFGLIYADPNGTPCFDLLRLCATQLPKTDILLHMSANNLKRQRLSTKHPFDQTLIAILQTINKQYWLIQDPGEGNRDQWTFLFGTNWRDVKEWRAQGFYRLDTPRGQAILHRLTYTKEELQADNGQDDLFHPRHAR